MRIILVLIGIIVATILFAITFSVAVAPATSEPGPVVKLTFKKTDPRGVEFMSHCSGTHLGGGVILTAEHCTRYGEMDVVDDHGGTSKTEVLWASKVYDIALVQADSLPIAKAEVSCTPPPVGTSIMVSGNPINLEWVTTSGKVLSGVHGNSLWKEVVAADITVAGGSSGGPVFGPDGKVVGVVVGMYEDARIGLFVPGATVCRLFGRA